MSSILITGAYGQLGSELKELSKQYYGYDFIFTDADTLDITNKDAVREFISNLKPGWVINCAAYNLVDKAESEPEAAMKINSTAVNNLTDAILNTDCRFIHVSTDYVYGSRRNVPCDEDTEPDPESAYARSKLSGEKMALVHPGTMVIRTSWLYSSYGNNFVKTMLKLGRERESLNVVFDQTGSPTYAADLADAIMKVVSGVIRNHFAFKPGIYNYSDEGVCTWFDFASEIMKEAGLNCRIMPVLSRDFQQAAKRPSYSVMDKTKIRENYNIEIPHWRTSLINCLKKIN
jgi:dTDP-4-dehydrorhamnose reductase